MSDTSDYGSWTVVEYKKGRKKSGRNVDTRPLQLESDNTSICTFGQTRNNNGKGIEDFSSSSTSLHIQVAAINSELTGNVKKTESSEASNRDVRERNNDGETRQSKECVIPKLFRNYDSLDAQSNSGGSWTTVKYKKRRNKSGRNVDTRPLQLRSHPTSNNTLGQTRNNNGKKINFSCSSMSSHIQEVTISTELTGNVKKFDSLESSKKVLRERNNDAEARQSRECVIPKLYRNSLSLDAQSNSEITPGRDSSVSNINIISKRLLPDSKYCKPTLRRKKKSKRNHD